jgi:uncharacterized surface protein with fasciclin (FAS1) repeats
MKKSMTSLFTMAAALALAACAAKPNPDTAPPTDTPAPEPMPVEATPPPEPEPAKPAEPPPPPAPTKDIVDTATEAGTFTTLLKAIDTAGLKDTLKGPGPFTVFAPNDEAFAKLPKAELDKLLKNKKKLADLLNYHVISGAAVKSTEASAMPTAKTVNGAEIAIDASNGVKLNGTATVVSADIATTNGVIHVIDTVLTVPKAGKAPKADKAAAKEAAPAK